jgi:transcriptional regulator with GAF, ATPase, and Fis domain
LPLTAEARAALVAYNWPGNVRELENVMLRSITCARRMPSRSKTSAWAPAVSSRPTSFPRCRLNQARSKA